MIIEGLLSNILSSVLMNGICCVHEMQEEEARRKQHEEFVRETIHIEFERQRVIEREILDKQLREQGLTDAALVAEARRKLLIATKIQARRQSRSVGSMDCSSRYGGSQYSMAVQERRSNSTLSPKSIVPPSSMNSRVSSAPVWCVQDADISGSASLVSSLLDEDEDDDETLDDILLRV